MQSKSKINNRVKQISMYCDYFKKKQLIVCVNKF
jgi:hypothetical protein